MFSFLSKFFGIYILISGITINVVFSQSPDKLLNIFEIYKKAKPEAQLFLHTDKTLYVNNETIWFSGYLMKCDNSKLHSILSVALIREGSQEITLQRKYLMRNGLSFGNLDLPDSLLAGNYNFVAYTNAINKAGKPIAYFTQPITLRNNVESNFDASLELIDTVIRNGVVRAKLLVHVKNAEKNIKPVFEYTVNGSKLQKSELTNNSYTFNISKDQLKSSSSILTAKVSYGKNAKLLDLKLPGDDVNDIKIRFFPEGGSLTNGLESTVGWESTVNGGQPIAVQTILYKNSTPIDTLNTDTYGIGKFKLKPESGYNYQIKLKSNPYHLKDSLYELPKPLNNGISLHLKQAVVNDTLKLNVFSKTPQTIQLIIHNYREIYAIAAVKATPTGGNATIALNALPKGIATVTIVDEMNRPLAERLFFAKYHQKINAVISTKTSGIRPKGTVNVNIRLTDQDGNPIDGLLSAAVIQEIRLEAKKTQNIEDYAYLNYDLGAIPSTSNGILNDKENLENILLIKGWRKYTWQDMVNTNIADTTNQLYEAVINGRVTDNGKPLKAAMSIINFRKNAVDLITTEPNGAFNLYPTDLLMESGQKMTLSVADKKKRNFLIELFDPFPKINKEIANSSNEYVYASQHTNYKSTDQQISGLEQNIQLSEVSITSTKSNNLYYPTNPRGANPCRDYVTDNFLNRPDLYNNPRNKPPEQGKRYIVGYKVFPSGELRGWDQSISDQKSWEWQWDVYAGCSINTNNNNIFKFEGIYTAREFYGVNGDGKAAAEPQFLSTLFWKPGITTKQGEAQFKFTAGDITDSFKINVQGVSEHEVFSGEHLIQILKTN